MTTPRAIIVADDLTGAADTGAPFAAAGFATAVPLRSTPPGAEVISLSNNTRDASATQIDQLFQDAMELLLPADSSTLWYAKVDSVFRGHPGPQIAFLLRHTGRRSVIIAPALPDQRRVTVEGEIYVDDILLTRTSLGIGCSSAAVIELLGLPQDLGQTIDLATVRSGVDDLRAAIGQELKPIVVVDAETNADLSTLAEAVLTDPDHLLAGSAGFAKQLAFRLAEHAGKSTHGGPNGSVRTVMTVAGSRHETSARQVDALEATGVETLRISFEDGHLSPQSIDKTVEAVLAASAEERSITLTTSGTPSSPLPGRAVAMELADLATDPRIREAYDAMILTGGDVAATVCSRLEAEAIWLGGEALPAIPWGTLHGGLRSGLPIVTKAGSFGDDSAMIDALAFLTGTVSAAGE